MLGSAKLVVFGTLASSLGLAIAAIGQVTVASDEPPGAHDPVIAKEKGYHYVFVTGPGIGVMRSRDRLVWEPMPAVFPTAPAWTASTIPGNRGVFWAPDISYRDGRWRLYYSISTFGSNHSAIGLATNKTLDAGSKDYKWVDEGLVIESNRGNNYNAIDPSVLYVNRRAYLAFGSFWSGIKLLELDSRSGKPKDPRSEPISLAFRPKDQDPADAVEAPFLWKHGRYIYLFASYDLCCRGTNSTYNIRVGRSLKPEGPYVDRDGKSMLDGGGTVVRKSEGRWVGPGHNAVYSDGGADWLVYHAYDAEHNGWPRLRIERLTWDKDGWPQVQP